MTSAACANAAAIVVEFYIIQQGHFQNGPPVLASTVIGSLPSSNTNLML